MVFAEPTDVACPPLRGDPAGPRTRIDLAGFPREALDTDLALAATLAGGPFVLGYQFDFETVRGNACIRHPLRARFSPAKGGSADALFDARGIVCNLPGLSKAAGSSGFFNVTPDRDGVLRRVPLVIRHRGSSTRTSPWPFTCVPAEATPSRDGIGGGRSAAYRRKADPLDRAATCW